MGSRRHLLLVVLLAACGKTTADPPSPPPPPPPPPPYLDDPEAVALCKALKPCAPGQYFMCATGGRREPPPSYQAPGVRIERLDCAYAKQGETFVVGIPTDDAGYLLGRDLLLRVRGTPDEVARAAAELALEGRPLIVDEACRPRVEGAGVVRFCVRGAWDEAKESCRFDPATGTVACAKGDPSLPLAACQRAFGGGGVVAREERFAGQEAHGARLLVIASDHVFGGMSTGAVVQPLRARGLAVHDAKCSPTGDYPWRYAHWGEGPDGERVFGDELLARLDTPAMRAAFAGDLSLHESEESPYLLLDPTGGADALVVPTRGCALPPGPREHDGVLEFYTSRYARNGPELRHCRVRLPSGRTMCGSVTPGTFCEAKR